MIAYSTPGAIIAVTVTLTILCSVLVVLRFFTRRPEGKRSLPDDWLCLAALVRASTSALQQPDNLTRRIPDHDLGYGH